MTKILSATPAAIREAAAVLRRGGLAAFPTETVYGLGADATNPHAVRAMFAAKGRPADHPVIVHLADASQLSDFAVAVPAEALKLAGAFWPGPMTLVLRRSERVNDLVTGGLDTVGLRIPAHPVAQALLKEFGGPIAAPSANRFGRVSATRAEHVAAELTGLVDLILDAGPCPVGVESTIIDCSSGRPAILRPGGVTKEQIEAVLGDHVSATAAGPRVSGRLPSHYAPQATVQIVPCSELLSRAADLAKRGEKVALLSSMQVRPADHSIIVLDLPDDAAKVAHSLYALLRQADELACDVVLVSLPDESGIGAAIADRLRRAAGPRE